MAISKSLLLNFLVICWLASQVIGGGEPLPCIQKLMPCQAYLKRTASPSPSPAAACCMPLKEMAASDAHCLCAVFNDQVILKNLNVTQDDALNLAKTCGANADISICSKGFLIFILPRHYVFIYFFFNSCLFLNIYRRPNSFNLIWGPMSYYHVTNKIRSIYINRTCIFEIGINS